MRFTRITVDPRQMGGVPCIRGLRMPVATVGGMVADGMTVDEILKEHPTLVAEDVREAQRPGPRGDSSGTACPSAHGPECGCRHDSGTINLLALDVVQASFATQLVESSDVFRRLSKQMMIFDFGLPACSTESRRIKPRQVR